MSLQAAGAEPLALTDIFAGERKPQPVGRRIRVPSDWSRTFRNLWKFGSDLALGLLRDRTEPPSASPDLLRMEPGTDLHADASSVAIYVHYTRSGAVSQMVLRQLRLVMDAGFAVVFVSNAPNILEGDWSAVRDICALAVHRRNVSLDFGAWRSVAPEVARRWPNLTELLLLNDSVLGPIRPLASLFDTLRSGGEGLFGLTESLQGGAHLQSYFLLTRGRAAIADVFRFLGEFRPSHAKWLVIRRGELRLTRWMRARGHRAAALFGYDRAVRLAVADAAELRRVAATHRRLAPVVGMSASQARDFFMQWPLNPTHHLWHVLVSGMGFPFLKTELVLRNPGSVPGVADWAEVVPDDAPCGLSVLQEHLATVAG